MAHVESDEAIDAAVTAVVAEALRAALAQHEASAATPPPPAGTAAPLGAQGARACATAAAGAPPAAKAQDSPPRGGGATAAVARATRTVAEPTGPTDPAAAPFTFGAGAAAAIPPATAPRTGLTGAAAAVPPATVPSSAAATAAAEERQWADAIEAHLRKASAPVPLVMLGTAVKRPPNARHGLKTMLKARPDRFRLVGSGPLGCAELADAPPPSAPAPGATPPGAAPGGAAALSAVERSWSDAIEAHLRAAAPAEPLPLTRIGDTLPRPAGARAVRSLIVAQPARFELCMRGKTECVALPRGGGAIAAATVEPPPAPPPTARAPSLSAVERRWSEQLEARLRAAAGPVYMAELASTVPPPGPTPMRLKALLACQPHRFRLSAAAAPGRGQSVEIASEPPPPPPPLPPPQLALPGAEGSAARQKGAPAPPASPSVSLDELLLDRAHPGASPPPLGVPAPASASKLKQPVPALAPHAVGAQPGAAGARSAAAGPVGPVGGGGGAAVRVLRTPADVEKTVDSILRDAAQQQPRQQHTAVRGGGGGGGGGGVSTMVALKCVPSGSGDGLEWIGLGLPGGVVALVDTHSLGTARACQLLWPLLSSPLVVKLAHGAHEDAALLVEHAGVIPVHVLDSMLVAEMLGGGLRPSLAEFTRLLGCGEAEAEGAEQHDEPRTPRAVAGWVRELAAAAPALRDALASSAQSSAAAAGGAREVARVLSEASEERVLRAAAHGSSELGAAFDPSQGFALGSATLLSRLPPPPGAPRPPPPLPPQPVTGAIGDLAHALPPQLARDLANAERSGAGPVLHLTLSAGLPPLAWTARGRAPLSARLASSPVSRAELEATAAALGGFDASGCARLDGSVHRVTAVRAADERRSIAAVSVSVRQVSPGCAGALADLLLGGDEASILVLGAAGAGRSSLLRDCARELASRALRVVAIDSHGALGGDGVVAHVALGEAVRVPVLPEASQAELIEDVLRSHAPHAIVVDELHGGQTEVGALRRARARGVRVLAGALGTLGGALAAGARHGGAHATAVSEFALEPAAAVLRLVDAAVQVEPEPDDDGSRTAGPRARQLLVVPDVRAAISAVRAGRPRSVQLRRLGPPDAPASAGAVFVRWVPLALPDVEDDEADDERY